MRHSLGCGDDSERLYTAHESAMTVLAGIIVVTLALVRLQAPRFAGLLLALTVLIAYDVGLWFQQLGLIVLTHLRGNVEIETLLCELVAVGLIPSSYRFIALLRSWRTHPVVFLQLLLRYAWLDPLALLLTMAIETLLYVLNEPPRPVTNVDNSHPSKLKQA